MCNGAAMRGSILSNYRSNGSFDHLGCIGCSAACKPGPLPFWRRTPGARVDAGRDFRYIGTPSGSDAVHRDASAFLEDAVAARVRRPAQPRGGGLGNGGRTPAGGLISCERVGETPAPPLSCTARAGPPHW